MKGVAGRCCWLALCELDGNDLGYHVRGVRLAILGGVDHLLDKQYILVALDCDGIFTICVSVFEQVLVGGGRCW